MGADFLSSAKVEARAEAGCDQNAKDETLGVGVAPSPSGIASPHLGLPGGHVTDYELDVDVRNMRKYTQGLDSKTSNRHHQLAQ